MQAIHEHNPYGMFVSNVAASFTQAVSKPAMPKAMLRVTNHTATESRMADGLSLRIYLASLAIAFAGVVGLNAFIL